MTPQETVLLVAYVKACCPQQAIGEYTPDAWHDLLGDLSLADAREAVAAVAKRQPFVAPAEIRAEVRDMQAERLRQNPPEPPPYELTDDPAAYRKALRESRLRVINAPQDGRKAIGGTP